MGVYSFSLSLISEHGCTDTFITESIASILEDHTHHGDIDPYFGCNELTIEV